MTTTSAGSDQDLLHRVEDGVAWITLNRPDAANAITYQQRNRAVSYTHLTLPTIYSV